MAFDKAAFGKALRNNALPPFGRHKCAVYVRMALEAAGLNTAGHPGDAKDWGPTLVRLGFAAIPATPYTPALGDIIVMQGTSASSSGHIEGYDGQNWISDFVQHAMWPGPSFREEQPDHTIYRSNR